MGRYTNLVIWIVVAVVALVLVKKIIKKAIGFIIVAAILVGIGCIPFSTVNTAVDTVKGGYQTITKSAALWSVEESEEHPDEYTIYILNAIPITVHK